MSAQPSPALSPLRRFTALLIAVLLFQANWQESGMVCMSEYSTLHHQAAGSVALSASGAVTEQAAMMHDGSELPHDARSLQASSSIGQEESLPSHGSSPGVPAHCAAMTACFAAAVTTTTEPLLPIEGLRTIVQVVAPDIRLHSLDVAPDIPPPRA